jgi:hypothetical protein
MKVERIQRSAKRPEPRRRVTGADAVKGIDAVRGVRKGTFAIFLSEQTS